MIFQKKYLKIKFFLSVALIISFTHVSVCSAKDSFPTLVLDSLGREVRIDKIPERIVSAVPSNTEILYDLGLKDKVIAVTAHCNLTCEVKGKKVINGWSNIDIKEIVSLKPDLVLAFGGLQVPLIDKLDRAGITVFSFCPHTVSETLQLLKIVGHITGAEQRAEKLVQEARVKLRKIQDTLKKIPFKDRIRCLRLISPEDIIVVGRYSFQHDIIVQAGGDNIMKELLESYKKVKFEDISSLNPEFIILNGDNEQEAIEKFVKLQGWKELSAVKEKRIKVMPCRLICHPNFQIVDVVEQLAQYLYPELFKDMKR